MFYANNTELIHQVVFRSTEKNSNDSISQGPDVPLKITIWKKKKQKTKNIEKPKLISFPLRGYLFQFHIDC